MLMAAGGPGVSLGFSNCNLHLLMLLLPLVVLVLFLFLALSLWLLRSVLSERASERAAAAAAAVAVATAEAAAVAAAAALATAAAATTAAILANAELSDTQARRNEMKLPSCLGRPPSRRPPPDVHLPTFLSSFFLFSLFGALLLFPPVVLRLSLIYFVLILIHRRSFPRRPSSCGGFFFSC